MNFDKVFAVLVRLTGWGLGAYVVVASKVDGTSTVAIILGFAGFELVSRAKEKKLPELIERKRENAE